MSGVYTNPIDSRNEKILESMIEGTEYTAPPQSRIEELLLELKAEINRIDGKADNLSFDAATRLLSLKSGNTVLSSVTIPTVEIVPFSSGTDAQIAAMIAAADRGDIDLYADAGWRVGDERQVTLSAMEATGTYDGVSWTVGETHVEQTVTLVLMDGGTTSETGDAFTGSAASAYELVESVYNKDGTKRTNPAFIVGMKNALLEEGYVNSTNSNVGSWNGCSRRSWCNGAFRASIPQVLRAVFKQFNTITAQTFDGNTNQTSQDYFALVASKEITGGTASQVGEETYYSNLTEFNALKQFEFYKTVDNRKKKRGDSGNRLAWWLRSIAGVNNKGYCCVLDTGTPSYNNTPSLSVGLTTFGCI